MQPVSQPDETDDSLVTWSGAPTRRALRELRSEFWCPPYDADEAAMVLSGMWEGNTLTKLCRTAGYPRRSTVMAWAEMVPEFADRLNRAQTALGSYQRDLAVEEEDPAMMRARIAAAGSFDRTIAKGEGDVQAVAGITVTVNRFEGVGDG